MYDFYNNPPKTRQNVRDYITSWLEKQPYNIIVKDNERFCTELGFRRAFCSHSVIKSLDTNEYLFWISEYYDLETFPTKRYPTYEAMLEGVIDDHCKQWKITE